MRPNVACCVFTVPRTPARVLIKALICAINGVLMCVLICLSSYVAAGAQQRFEKAGAVDEVNTKVCL